MTDLKQISDEIAAAIFDRIEQDRTLILSNVADVIHKALAVRIPERKEPDPARVEKIRRDWDQFRKIVREWKPKLPEIRGYDPKWIAWDLSEDFPTTPHPSKDTEVTE